MATADLVVVWSQVAVHDSRNAAGLMTTARVG